MAVVKCPSCGRFNSSDKLEADGYRCELCQAPIAAPPPPPLPAPADPEPAAINVTLAEVDGDWGTFPGRVVTGVGTALMFLGAAAAWVGILAGEREAWPWVAGLFVGGAALGTVGGLVFGVGKRMAARSADRAEEADGRPPVLLLRRFLDDDIEFGVRRSAGPVGTYMPNERQTFEELVAEAAAVAGPVVAIGDPKEGLPKLGAARAYVGNDAWQARVDEYLGRAGVVVMLMSRMDGEHGLAWELRTVWAAVPPDRLVFIVPPVGDDEARRRWTDFHDRSGGRLPPYQGDELAAGFDPDGTCRVVRGEGDRRTQGEQYAATVARFAQAAAARRAENPPGELTLEVVPPARSALGRLGRRFPLGSWKAVLVLFVATQISCASTQAFGRPDLALTWQLPGWRAYAAQVPLIVGATTAGVMMLAFMAALERRVKRFQPTNILFALASFAMVVAWGGAAALTARLAHAVATGRPGGGEPDDRLVEPEAFPTNPPQRSVFGPAGSEPLSRRTRATFQLGDEDRKSKSVTIPEGVIDRLKLGANDVVVVRIERFERLPGGELLPDDDDLLWTPVHAHMHEMRSGRKVDLSFTALDPDARIRIAIVRQ